MDGQRRTITDVRVLAALAHPVRVSLLHYLLAAGPRTATECAAVVDASPSACSYHLRHLERFGLVERAEPGPDEAVDGRTRRWRPVATGFSFGGPPSTASPEMVAAHHTLVATGLAEDLRLARHHLDHADELPPAWQDAAEFSTYGLAGHRGRGGRARRRDRCPGPPAASGRPPDRAAGSSGGAPRRRCVRPDGPRVTITATDLAPTVSPWRNRNFCLVWGGGLVNDIGDWLLRVALPVYVFTTTGSGTVTAIVFLIEVVVAAAVGPFGGGLADRCDLRRVLIATNLVQAVTLLPLLAVRSGRIWPAFIVAAVQSALTACNDPAKVALLPRLVRADQLTVANAANSTSASLARLIGAPIGGLAVGLGGLGAVVAIDGLSFLFVAGMTVLVRARTAPIAPAAPASPEPGGEVRRGLRLVRQHPPLPALVGIFGIAAVAQGLFVVLFVVFVVDALGGGGTQVGVIRGMMAVGAMVGAVLVARLGRHVDPMVLLAVGLAGLGGVSLLFWNAPVVTTTWVSTCCCSRCPASRARRCRWGCSRPCSNAAHRRSSGGSLGSSGPRRRSVSGWARSPPVCSSTGWTSTCCSTFRRRSTSCVARSSTGPSRASGGGDGSARARSHPSFFARMTSAAGTARPAGRGDGARPSRRRGSWPA